MSLQNQICGGLHEVFGFQKNIKPIVLSKRKTCTLCDGEGELEENCRCPICKGDGCIYEDRLTEDDFIQDIKE